MTTIRIYVEHDGPLDGVSPLHPESTSAWNHELGLLEIWSPPHAALGRLHLAPLVSDGRGSEHWVEHLTVLSRSGRHAQGSLIGLAPPALTDITPEHPPALCLVDLGACEDTASGVLTEGLGVPIPVGHTLVVDTRANAKTPGPHLIQISLGRVPQFLQSSVPSQQPTPPRKRHIGSPVLDALVSLGGGRTIVTTQFALPEDGQPELQPEQTATGARQEPEEPPS